MSYVKFFYHKRTSERMSSKQFAEICKEMNYDAGLVIERANDFDFYYLTTYWCGIDTLVEIVKLKACSK